MFSDYSSVDFLCQMNKRAKIKLCLYMIDLDFLVGLWIVTIWTSGFLFNSVEQFDKCFIFCCKLSIAMTKSKLFWCMYVLANQKVGKTRKPLYGKEVDWYWPKSSWFNLVFLQLFSFRKTKPMSFCPLPYNLCIVKSTLSFDGFCTLVNIVIIDAIRVDLVSWVFFFHGVATIVALQAKNGFYYNWFLVDMF